jgi:4-hydroxybenzoate polyprenyltransferase
MLSRIRTYGSFIRFSHTVFALPFALSGALLAVGSSSLTWGRVGWIVLAMTMARTAAMGFNRIVDARYDAQNPRTANRELPRGVMTMREASGLVVISSVAFVAVTWTLGPLCFALSPIALGIVFWYSFSKRFTMYAQLFLGLALAVAPVGGWLAAGGGWGWPPWLLAFGTAMWVAGFDILYACDDIEIDRVQGLKSIPVRFGVAASLRISRVFHAVAVASLAAVAVVMPLGPLYLVGVIGVGALLAYEQSLVRSDDLSRVKDAFDLNGWVGILYLMTTAGALYVG